MKIAVTAATAVLIVLAGCSGSGSEPSATTVERIATTSTTTSSTTTTTTTTTTTPPTTTAPPPTTAPPTTAPPANPDAELQAIIDASIREASADTPILSHDCGPMDDDYVIVCSVTVEGGYGMYLMIQLSPTGNYTWQLMGGE